jgi:hypothetical protein
MAPVVATLTLSESGQSENLLQDTTLILGRHTFEGVKSPHISRKQGKRKKTSCSTTKQANNAKCRRVTVCTWIACHPSNSPTTHSFIHSFVHSFSHSFHVVQLTSKGDEITITNLGTNRSSLNRTALSNDTPTKVKDGDKITLIEVRKKKKANNNTTSMVAT